MIKGFVALLLFASLLASAALAADVKPPKRTPVPTTERHAALVKEGTALHDRGDFDGAIKKYEEVLAENPDDVLALYELSYTLSAKKDYRRALEIAERVKEFLAWSEHYPWPRELPK